MAQNSLYPGFVKLKYSSNAHTHYQILPVIFDVTPDPGQEPIFTTRNGSTVLMNDAVDAYCLLIDGLFNTSASFILAECWLYDTPESDPHFVYAYEIGVLGTSGTATLANSQLVISLRTAGGGYLKLYYMETISGLSAKDDYPFAQATVDAIADYLIDPATGWIVGRDNTHPISGLRALAKTNDALRKKFVLNV